MLLAYARRTLHQLAKATNHVTHSPAFALDRATLLSARHLYSGRRRKANRAVTGACRGWLCYRGASTACFVWAIAVGAASLNPGAAHLRTCRRHGLTRQPCYGFRLGLFVRPNVRAKPTAEAGAVSPARDDSTTGAGRAYSACRSGSA